MQIKQKLNHKHLPRLNPEAYQGLAMVHWSMTMRDRRCGWLNDAFHAGLREIMLHTAVCYGLWLPVYCLMPEHIHLLAVGLRHDCDQIKALIFFRRHCNALFSSESGSQGLQKQAYDNVLRESDRERGAFQSIAEYILDNPVREHLVDNRRDWSHSGCMVPGKPQWNVFHAEYWDSFWDHYARQVRL